MKRLNQAVGLHAVAWPAGEPPKRGSNVFRDFRTEPLESLPVDYLNITNLLSR